MILLDYREETETKKKANLDLEKHFVQLHQKPEVTNLSYGDAAVVLKGPDNSQLMVGFERKGLHDILNCIDDSRYNMQRIGMKQMYDLSVLIIEGHWRAHEQGWLMEGFNGGMTWGFCKYRSQRPLYSKLYRYLISVTLSGVIVTFTRDPFHTAYNIVEWMHYGEKAWDKHTSLLEMQKVSIPTLNTRPSLVRKWANDLDGVGTLKSAEAERLFKTPIRLAQADEMEWLKIKGIGVPSARNIVKQIWGR